ncbi:MAG: hypothetical protein R3194_07655 [Limnobacter sp.]|nr:hypothetical protein [Limnobacter sp.]
MKPIFLLVIAFILSGCASQTRNQLHTFAEAGQEFTKLVRKVNQTSQKESLAFSADLLPVLPRTRETLDTHSDLMRARIELLATQREQLDLLERYFAHLEQVSKGRGSNKTEQALADLLYALQDTLKLTRKESSDTAEVTLELQAQRGLIHTSKAHAPLIARVIQAVASGLKQQAQWLEMRDDLSRVVALRDEVEKPFLSGKALPAKWKNAWMASVSPPPSRELLVQAQVATQALLTSWTEFTEGRDETASLTLILSQLNRSLIELEKSP